MKRALNGLKSTLTGVAAGLAMLASVPAQATAVNGIIDVWTVGVSGQFLCGTAVFDPSSTGTSCGLTQMRWGTSTGPGQSGLDISNLPSASVITNGAAVANTSVTHLNQPITGNSLDQVTLRSTLTLTPFSPGAPGLAPVSLDFFINFEETDNGANPCAGGGANNQGVNISGCADIFVIDQNALNFPFFYDFDNGGPLPNQQYFISFFELTSGLNPLPNAACTAAGATAPCLGFRTPEGQNTTFQFAALITTQPVTINVPEPGTLATVGLALLALGAVRRRRA